MSPASVPGSLSDSSPPGSAVSATPQSVPPPYEILVEGPGHAADVEALYDEVFGPGRFAKTAERLREGNRRIPQASLVAIDDLGLTGVVRMWPVRVGGADGAVLLGPLAVAERRRRNGVAFSLMERAIATCAAAGARAVILVGDEAYYARAGFRRAEAGRFTLPGPVDPARVLVRELTADAGALSGALSAPPCATPAS